MKRLVIIGLIIAQSPLAAPQPRTPATDPLKPVTPPATLPTGLDPTLTPYADPSANPYLGPPAAGTTGEPPGAPAHLDPTLTPYADPLVNPYIEPAVERRLAPARLDPMLTPYADPLVNPYIEPAVERRVASSPLDPTLTPYSDPATNPYIEPAAVERPLAPARLDPMLTPYADPSANPYLEPNPYLHWEVHWQGASSSAFPATASSASAPAAPAAPSKPSAEAPIDPYATAPQPADVASLIPRRVGIADVAAVQGLLAVQRLDGWLLFDRDGENPIAVRLVAPEGHPTRPWFYLIPARGNPVALVHAAELRSFDHLAGTKLTYQGYRDLDRQLRAMLKGVKSVAVEFSVKAAVPSVSRVDPGTLELIRAAGVQVKSSDTLVQFTKAIWGDPGRTAHYVAVHHVVELRKEALAFVVKQLQSGAPVTEYDVQQRIVHGMAMRGLVGAPPVVAAGVNTADPYYAPSADKTAAIKRGDLIVISLAAKLDKPDGVYAVQTWCAVADVKVPEPIAKAFETASLARDQAMGLISDRVRKHRPVTGAEVDDATRAFIKKAGFADRVMHRTGHSIDNDLQGGGADLDDFEVKDSRILTPGTGFTVGPGLYFPGQFGVRSEVSVYLAPGGPEVTTPAQDDVEALLHEGP